MVNISLASSVRKAHRWKKNVWFCRPLGGAKWPTAIRFMYISVSINMYWFYHHAWSCYRANFSAWCKHCTSTLFSRISSPPQPLAERVSSTKRLRSDLLLPPPITAQRKHRKNLDVRASTWRHQPFSDLTVVTRRSKTMWVAMLM